MFSSPFMFPISFVYVLSSVIFPLSELSIRLTSVLYSASGRLLFFILFRSFLEEFCPLLLFGTCFFVSHFG